MMHPRITPKDDQQLALRMLFQPVGDGTFGVFRPDQLESSRSRSHRRAAGGEESKAASKRPRWAPSVRSRDDLAMALGEVLGDRPVKINAPRDSRCLGGSAPLRHEGRERCDMSTSYVIQLRLRDGKRFKQRTLGGRQLCAPLLWSHHSDVHVGLDKELIKHQMNLLDRDHAEEAVLPNGHAPVVSRLA